MPIYEYKCQKCKHEFEKLVLTNNDQHIECPECKSNRADKLLSAGSFRPNGIPTGSGGYAPPACAPYARRIEAERIWS